MLTRLYAPALRMLVGCVIALWSLASLADNQAKLDEALSNQAAIISNQQTILSNQEKLDTVIANQERILANQEQILGK